MNLASLSSYIEWSLVVMLSLVGLSILSVDLLLGLGYIALATIICPLTQAPHWVRLVSAIVGFVAL